MRALLQPLALATFVGLGSAIAWSQTMAPEALLTGTQHDPQEIRQVPSALGCIALTFDDGPDPTLTPELLSILAEEDVVVTFFALGDHVVASPEIARQAVTAGHELGNHSWSHAHLPQLSPEEIRAEIADTDRVIFNATGQLPATFRLPYGESNETVYALVNRPMIRWDVDPYDWVEPAPTVLAETVQAWARSGSIVILHDIFATTIDAVRPIVQDLKNRGYQFVTVSRLLTGEPCPGPAYDRFIAKYDAIAQPATSAAPAAAAEKTSDATVAAR